MALRAGDDDAALMATNIIDAERAAARAIREQFEPAVGAALEAQGVGG